MVFIDGGSGSGEEAMDVLERGWTTDVQPGGMFGGGTVKVKREGTGQETGDIDKSRVRVVLGHQVCGTWRDRFSWLVCATDTRT